jgi:nitrous oxidase accessory protein
MGLARLSAFVLMAGTLAARTFTVPGGTEFATLRDAVQAAAAGDTIEVRGGTYDGNIVLDKPLALVGAGHPLLRGDGVRSVITITAPGCSIRGFRIEHSGGMLVDEDSGILIKSDDNRVEQNDLQDVLFGIYLFHSNRNVIRANSIRGRKQLGPGERGAGIHIWYSAGNTIDENVISLMRDGMYLQNADQSVIRGNHVFDLRYGLHYMYSNDNIFEDNIFENNIAGAAIMYSRRIQFRRNAFLHNRGFSSFGILFQDSQDCIAEQNLIADNVIGIFMESLRHSRFERNLITANDTAIEAFASAEQNDFSRNNFVSNLSPIRVIGRSSNTNWERNGIGNYWSEYRGYDLDGDGVGDVPFRVQNLFEHLESNRPRMRIYFFSPAAQALAAAEEGFPILALSREFDPHPLMHPVDIGIKIPETQTARLSARLSLSMAPAALIAVAAITMWRQRNSTRRRVE